MTKRAATIALMGGMFALVLTVVAATPASAQLAFLSHTGSGASCTQSAPCAVMNTAINVAGANGEVICLDKGTYDGGTITQPVTISCGDGWWEVSCLGGVTVNTPAGSDVVIEGLVMDQLTCGSAISMNGQGALHLRRVRVGHTGGGSHGLDFAPNGLAMLHITDSVFYNNGGAGVYVKPTSGVQANVYINRTHFEKNGFGITADGSGGGAIGGVVRDSVVSGNANTGITTFSGGTSITLVVQNSTIAGNNFGLAASGPNAGILVTRSAINYNGTGVFGPVYSYGDNSLNGNGADGTFAATIGLR
jgi:hypothetical protein